MESGADVENTDASCRMDELPPPRLLIEGGKAMPEGAGQVRKKSNLWKWLLGCGCLALVLCGLGVGLVIYYFSQSITTDPVKAKRIAETIIRFDVPEGHQMKFAADMLGVKIAAFARVQNEDAGLVCVIMRFPKSLNLKKADMEARMNDQMQKQGSGQMTTESQDTVTLSVGVGEVEADCRIVVDQKSGKKKKQYLLFLERQDGMVMIQLMGPADDFDTKSMRSFLDSVK
jgi:hypothetical protein